MIKSIPELTDKIIKKHSITGVQLIIGNGPSKQQDLKQFQNDQNKFKQNQNNFNQDTNYQFHNQIQKKSDSLFDTLSQINQQHGNKKWLAVQGGDTYSDDQIDLGTLMFQMKQEFNPYLLSVQSWSEVDNFVDQVWMQDKDIDEISGREYYGGVFKDEIYSEVSDIDKTYNDLGQILRGGTKVQLGYEFRMILNGVVDIGAKGKVGSKEIEFAGFAGMDIIRVNLPSKIIEVIEK